MHPRCTSKKPNLDIQVRVRKMSAPNLRVRFRFTKKGPNLNRTGPWPVYPHPNPRTPGPVTRSGLADPCHSLSIAHQLDLTSHVPRVCYVTLQEWFTYVFSSHLLHPTLFPVHPNSHRHVLSQTRIGPLMKKTVKVSLETVSFFWTP